MLKAYISDLKASKNKLTDFDEGLFYALVDKVKVNENNVKIIWKDGTEGERGLIFCALENYHKIEYKNFMKFTV